jgi:3-dehydroquinate synthase
MGVSLVSNVIRISSYKSSYEVIFDEDLFSNFHKLDVNNLIYIIDSKIAHIYRDKFPIDFNDKNCIIIEAKEENKSIEKVIPIMHRLVTMGMRRDHTLLAIGGGVIQDITCFIASIFLRGVKWQFIPTTLLAQADSCIGSKSSINMEGVKNVLGTFNPPEKIYVCSKFLNSLQSSEMHSGVGEMIKVHAIAGPSAFKLIAENFNFLFSNRAILLSFIRKSLEIKKEYIEIDEFDLGKRRIFNYGHSFGHAIEIATRFVIPHGIAVTMGMEVANKIALSRNLISIVEYQRMSPVLKQNYSLYSNVEIPINDFLSALKKDKKNTATNLVLVMPIGSDMTIDLVTVSMDQEFVAQCESALLGLKK